MPNYLNKEVLVLGCGNILFGDDGFGYTVINELNKMKEKNPILNSNKIEIIDAGTGASHFILSLIDENTPIKKIVIIDAIEYGLKAGELIKLHPKDLPNIEKYRVDAHDMPLAGMLNELNEKYKIDVVVIGCQIKNMTAPDICLELSKEVKKSINNAVNMVLEELQL
ncbi:coenzyme F420-reducing hydrogenase, FrhD protein [Methanothermococcus sp.]|uniref:coenzyme F420-reducing hydrogenase, FrhD protein n=1 Tax=Methanothermococcus sp. TaxID=2614238 RepID=UPI0025DE3E4B|nr:coenzyme F420-reducing hydrogenase, FrhD protein [Methanothermococcus sp.]